MMKRRARPVPEPITHLERQLEQFRSTQTMRTKLPEPLWQAAVELARRYGVYAVAHPLRLDYMKLRQRLTETPNSLSKATQPAFVELIAPHSVAPVEWLIEFESVRGGGKMRIQWKAAAEPDWANLLRAWRDTER